MPRLPTKRSLPPLKKKPLKKHSATTIQSMRVGGYSTKSTELKYLDNNAGTAVNFGVSTFTTPVLLNGASLGSDAINRIGRKLVMKSLLFRWTWNLAATSTGGSPVRIMIVYDKQANAATPAITDILLADSHISQNNLNNRDRFVVLSDEISEPVSVQGTPSISGVIYKKLNLETVFNGTNGGTVADITSGSIHVLFSQTAGIGTANPTVNWRSRIRFYDV